MYVFLSVVFICLTLIGIVYMLQGKELSFRINYTYEDINNAPEAKQVEENEEEKQVYTAMTNIIQQTQEFLGGEVDAESKPKAE